MIKRQDFVQRRARYSCNWRKVRRLAGELEDHLNDPQVSARLSAVNQPGMSSAEVQEVFLEKAISLGFEDESKGRFQSYETSALRPDYYRPVGRTGTILEVERGKTTINNMVTSWASAGSRSPSLG